jgi:glycerol uptake operon antiterminator
MLGGGLVVNFLTVLKKFPVIAAFREIRNLKIGELRHVGIIFILGGTIFDLPKIVEFAGRHERMVFVDIDLIKGAGKDAAGIRYLAKESRVHGIITTKSNLISSARKEGLSSIQRIFLLDSESLTGGLSVVEKSKPDAVEILPGLILPKIMDRIQSLTAIPIIAGGLITRKEEIREILSSGAVGISTTSSHLFSLANSASKNI